MIINYFSGSSDFFVTNHYSSMLCSPGDKSEWTYDKDLNVRREFDPSWPKSASDWLRVSYLLIPTYRNFQAESLVTRTRNVKNLRFFMLVSANVNLNRLKKRCN